VTALLACEIDRDLAGTLRSAGLTNLRVIEGDFLATSAASLRHELDILAPDAGPVRVAGNLPYNVASPILFHLIDLIRDGLPIVDATVMLQREVAERLLAAPATREYGVLTVLLGHRARVERLLDLPPGAFRPPPNVHSAVVRLRFHPPQPPVTDELGFATVTQRVFSRRRKTIANALLAIAGTTPPLAARALDAARIDPRRRPETLAIGDLVRLTDGLATVVRLGTQG
jgi:16S rRNA (adenine1518-N6/adenine1519-N6)-dimethyltransferase